MADVARLAGCSQATVSVVLNETGSVKISEEKKQSVKDAAAELGYVVHKRKGGAKKSPINKPLALYVNRLANSPEAPLVINGARDVCLDLDWPILVAEGINDPGMENDALEMLLSQNPVGLIYSEMTTKVITLPKTLMDVKLPVILVNCYTRDGRFPCILPDEIGAGRMAADHLLSFGHERIAVIAGESWMEASPQRLQGAMAALEEAGLPLRPEYVCHGNWHESSGYNGAHTLLSLDVPPTAIICQNDRIALGVYLYAKERGIRIPDDLSIIGNDDDEFCRHISPMLSTIQLPLRDMGGAAVRKIASGDLDPGRTIVDCPLVLRNSVSNPS